MQLAELLHLSHSGLPQPCNNCFCLGQQPEPRAVIHAMLLLLLLLPPNAAETPYFKPPHTHSRPCAHLEIVITACERVLRMLKQQAGQLHVVVRLRTERVRAAALTLYGLCTTAEEAASGGQDLENQRAAKEAGMSMC
jgi:hypothetical protein